MTIETTLAGLIQERGAVVYQDRRLLRALLNDLAPMQTLKINLLVAAAQSGVPHVLATRGAGPLTVALLQALMVEQHGVERLHAVWAVDTWVAALKHLQQQPRQDGYSSEQAAIVCAFQARMEAVADCDYRALKCALRSARRAQDNLPIYMVEALYNNAAADPLTAAVA